MTSKLLIFPWKLHDLLIKVERNNQTDIISWTPGGNSFKVHDKERFCNEIMPDFFAGQSPQFKTFQRSLNLWGFKYVGSSSLSGTKRGNHKSIEYSHAYFVQGNPDMCLAMKRVRVRGLRNRTCLRSQVSSSKKKRNKMNPKKTTGTKKSASKVAKVKPVAEDDSSATNNNGSRGGADAAGETTTSESTTVGEHRHILSTSIAGPSGSHEASGSDNPLVEMVLQRLLVPTVTPLQHINRQDLSNNLGLAVPPNNVFTIPPNNILAGFLGGHNLDQIQLGSSAVMGTLSSNPLLPALLSAVSLIQQQRPLQLQQHRDLPSTFHLSPFHVNPLVEISNNNPMDQLLQIINNVLE